MKQYLKNICAPYVEFSSAAVHFQLLFQCGGIDLAIPADEKHAKFREIATRRTNKAIEAIERIGSLSNRQLYEWEPAEVKKIVKSLRDEIAKVEARFEAPGLRRRDKFS